jgi:NAD(P)H dehydrogenase (quinone)
MNAVIGATGNTGRAAVKELKALGENPLCVVRNPDKAKEVLGADAKTAVAEITDKAALQKALKGCDSVFMVTGHGPQVADQQIGIIESAKAAGVGFLVKVSGGKAVVKPDAESAVFRSHYAVEEALKKSGLKWCILRPGLFMQNTFTMAQSIKADGKMIAPFPKDMLACFIDVRDTGAVGARVVRDPGKHAGQTYNFTGAKSNYESFAKDFSAVLGKPITYIAASLEAAEQGMRSRNMPDWLIAHLLAVARAGAAGAFAEEMTKPIHDIVGRAPITTRQFVQDFKAAFA